MSLRKGLISVTVLLSVFFRLSAQEKDSQVDSLVRLLSAQSMELIEKDGLEFRRVIGPARFLHNDTYLICDTALWNVTVNQIFAINNVKILQDQTVLTSDRLTYYVDMDLAEFRGSLVQLEDKDNNVLRTESLDYNTKDSVAVFFGGGSMQDKDGQIIESDTGTYDSKIKTFTFTDNVNMFTDSIFVKSTTLVYDSGRNRAVFGYATDAWSDDNMLSSNAGWYDRTNEVFLFKDNVHGMSDVQEGWADSLFYYRSSGDVELLGNAQITDSTKELTAVAGRMFYEDSLSRIKMTRDPAIIGIVRAEGEKPDSVYFGADTIICRSYMMFQVPDGQKKHAESRIADLSADAVQTYRKKAAAAAEEAAEKAAANDPNRAPAGAAAGGRAVAPEQKPEATAESGDKPADTGDPATAGANPVLNDATAVSPDSTMLRKGLPTVAGDSLAVAEDSLGIALDSLAAGADSPGGGLDSSAVASARRDSLSGPLDSTKVNFIRAISNVKAYKSDVQMVCDSLEYNDLDSLVRLYRSPVIWNETNRQYSADSLYLAMKGRSLDKASLMSNAFIIVQEDTLCYDQIKAAEMLAYFDTTGALKRFDALGEASAVFFLQEDSVYATVNKSEARMLYATFKDGDLDRVYYFEETKNDAYPLAQMSAADKSLKGFNWQPELRPVGKRSITALSQRTSERSAYASREKASFKYTDKYFPGYMPGVYDKIARGKAARELSGHGESADEVAAGDSLALADSPAAADSLASTDSQASADSLGLRKAEADSLGIGSDSLAVSGAAADSLRSGSASAAEKALSAKEQKAKARAERRAAKIAAREARWAQLDSLDAARDKAMAERKAAKIRRKKLKTLQDIRKQESEDNARLDRYKEMFRRRKEKEDRRKLQSSKSRKAELSASEDAVIDVEEKILSIPQTD